MFIAIYQFEIKPGFEDQFQENWFKLTELIYRNCNSLGSRLHRSKDGVFIAYAQWPSREIWEKPSVLPDEATEIRRLMIESCHNRETLYELEVVKDYLQNVGV